MNLKIDYQATRTTGNNVKNQAGEFKTLLNEIQNQNEELKQHWQGADADSYTSKITEQKQVMDKLQASMDEIGDYLIKVANAYEEAMEENKVQ